MGISRHLGSDICLLDTDPWDIYQDMSQQGICRQGIYQPLDTYQLLGIYQTLDIYQLLGICRYR